MKIGIITLPLHYNYGGMLQNYALQQVLKHAGHQVVTLDHESYSILSSIIPPFVRRILRRILGLENKVYELNEEENAIVCSKVNQFRHKYIVESDKLKSEKDFVNFAHKNSLDAYIVGSDQCWRPCYNKGAIQDEYLSFLSKDDDAKRIAYAASFGTDKWEYNAKQTTRFSELAKRFDVITVREKSGVKLCKDNLGVDATHVLDPTMLLCKEDYIKLIEAEQEPMASGTLFNYILDPDVEKSKFIKRVADDLSLTPFQVLPKYQAENRTKENVKNHIEDCVFPGVTTWLRAFMDAEMVIVDSFHGMVFSIIFNKPFWVIGNTARGMSRFSSLLQLFHLDNRLLAPSELDKVDYKLPIDWSQVNTILREKREESLNILLNALK